MNYRENGPVFSGVGTRSGSQSKSAYIGFLLQYDTDSDRDTDPDGFSWMGAANNVRHEILGPGSRKRNLFLNRQAGDLQALPSNQQGRE